MAEVQVVIHGEIAEVEQRGESEEASRVIRFSFHRTYPQRPAQKEYLLLFGVEFQIKKIRHEPHLVLRLTPATVTSDTFSSFLADAAESKWKIETVH